MMKFAQCQSETCFRTAHNKGIKNVQILNWHNYTSNNWWRRHNFSSYMSSTTSRKISLLISSSLTHSHIKFVHRICGTHSCCCVPDVMRILLCRLNRNITQRVCEFYVNLPVHLKIILPLWKTCNKSSTEGVWISTGVAQYSIIWGLLFLDTVCTG